MKRCLWLSVCVTLSLLLTAVSPLAAQEAGAGSPPILNQWTLDLPRLDLSSPVTFSPDGQKILASNGQIWNVADGTLAGDIREPGEEKTVYKYYFTPDSSRVLVAKAADYDVPVTLELWDAALTSRVWSATHSPIADLVISHDGSMFAVLAADTEGLEGWNLETGERVWEDHDWYRVCRYGDLKLSPDGKKVAFGCGDHFNEWEIKTGTVVGQFSCTSAAYLADGRPVCAQWSNTFIGNPNDYRGNGFGVSTRISSIYVADNGAIIFLTQEPALEIGDLKMKKIVHKVSVSGSLELDFSTDGEYVAVDFGTSIGLISTSAGEQLREWTVSTDEIENVKFSPDGTRLVSVDRNNHVIVWDLSVSGAAQPASQAEPVLPTLYGVEIIYPDFDDRSFAFPKVAIPEIWFPPTGVNPRYAIHLTVNKAIYETCRYQQLNGGQTATIERVRADIQVKIVDLQTNAVSMQRQFPGSTPAACPESFSSTGAGGVRAGLPDETAYKAWLSEFAARAGLPDFPVEVNLLSDSRVEPIFNADGTHAAGLTDKNSVLVWNTATGETEHQWTMNARDEANIQSIEFSPDSRSLLLVTTSASAPVQVFDLATDQPAWSALPAVASAYNPEAHFGSNGEVFVAAYDSDPRSVVLQMLDGQTGEERYRSRLDETAGSRFVVSPTGKRLLLLGRDNSADVIDANSGAALFKLVTTVPIYDSSFSPDDQRILTAASTGLIQLWNGVDGAEVAKIEAMTGATWAKFSPDGQTIVAASDDGSARLFDAATGTQRQSLIEHGNLRAETIQFNADGRLIALVDGNALPQIHIWDVATAQEVRTLSGHSVRFSPAGNDLLIGQDYGVAAIWDIGFLSGQNSGAAAETGGDCSGTVTAASAFVNVRGGPGTSFAVLTTLTNGTQVAVVRRAPDWYQISVDGKDGWVSGQLLSVHGAGCAELSSE